MPAPATFEHFERELGRLVEQFGRHLDAYKGASYDEANVRKDFLDPFFRALGWDMDNRAGRIPKDREVEIESRTQIGGRNRPADYLFRAEGRERFVCEAKKPAGDLDAGHAFQAKRYAWNKDLPLALLTDFEELKVYLVGGRPHRDEPDAGLWKTWHFRQFPLVARELWNLLSREAVAGGGIDRLIDALPKRPTGRGKARQQWLLKPDRTRALDADFLNFLDEARRGLASDLWRLNDHEALLAGNRLNDAVHRILDRLLFLRICEDRDMDTGERLDTLVAKWRRASGEDDAGRRARQQPLALREEPPAAGGRAEPAGSLWRAVVRHLRALDRRPPSHVPFFNGNLFKPHFSEELAVGDEWLAGFIGDLSDEETPYLFDVIPVEILGTIYERFLGKVVRPHGRGITVEEKPEVRKAGGVYYTPRYIVDYIVEQTVGKLVAGQPPEATLKLRILDPACGSGSF
ncbi:MAG: N-6 DNA methylase, partial [Limisphaerales bacterium]